jgi:hypothetical protein
MPPSSSANMTSQYVAVSQLAQSKRQDFGSNLKSTKKEGDEDLEPHSPSAGV